MQCEYDRHYGLVRGGGMKIEWLTDKRKERVDEETNHLDLLPTFPKRYDVRTIPDSIDYNLAEGTKLRTIHKSIYVTSAPSHLSQSRR